MRLGILKWNRSLLKIEKRRNYFIFLMLIDAGDWFFEYSIYQVVKNQQFLSSSIPLSNFGHWWKLPLFKTEKANIVYEKLKWKRIFKHASGWRLQNCVFASLPSLSNPTIKNLFWFQFLSFSFQFFTFFTFTFSFIFCLRFNFGLKNFVSIFMKEFQFLIFFLSSFSNSFHFCLQIIIITIIIINNWNSWRSWRRKIHLLIVAIIRYLQALTQQLKQLKIPLLACSMSHTLTC